MELPVILPVLDSAKLQEKASEFAMEGAIKTLKEYYTGYNSPYVKAIEEKLKQTPIDFALDLPDIIALINSSLSKELDALANTAIAQTFVPLVKRFLVREPQEMRFSKFLETIVRDTDGENIENYEVSVTEHSQYGWLDVKLYVKDSNYQLTFHKDSASEKKNEKKYTILSMPSGLEKGKCVISSDNDGIKVELPMTTDILKDKVCSFVARLIMAGTIFIMDTTEFSGDMIEHRCHC